MFGIIQSPWEWTMSASEAARQRARFIPIETLNGPENQVGVNGRQSVEVARAQGVQLDLMAQFSQSLTKTGDALRYARGLVGDIGNDMCDSHLTPRGRNKARY